MKNTYSKKGLYESIMKNVSKSIKNILNESSDFNDVEYNHANKILTNILSQLDVQSQVALCNLLNEQRLFGCDIELFGRCARRYMATVLPKL